MDETDLEAGGPSGLELGLAWAAAALLLASIAFVIGATLAT